MKLDSSTFEEEDEKTWVISSLKLDERRPPISFAVFSESGRPTKKVTERIEKWFSNLDDLIVEAAEQILDNYSYEHFKKLGIPEERLVAEDANSIATAVTLESIYVFDPDGCSFEMSFSAPWDDHHSFDVEFEDGEATTCAVNG